MNKVIRIHPGDNVLVAIRDLKKGEIIEWEGKRIDIKEDIDQKHKFPISDLRTDDLIYMYGVPIGKANYNIISGSRISIDNTIHYANPIDLDNLKLNNDWDTPDTTSFSGKTFNGYHRADGRVGTRNYWLVIPLVFCENRNVRVIKEALEEQLGYGRKKENVPDISRLVQAYKNGAQAQDIIDINLDSLENNTKKDRLFPQLDGIKFLEHDGGCGGTRQDSEALCALLAGYINNANVAGATVLSLGCQNAQMSILKEKLNNLNVKDKPVYYLEQQAENSNKKFIEKAIKLTFSGCIYANTFQRSPAPISKLTLGLECGGSDGFSGISANPALGYSSDILVSLGGNAILSEFPELNGVEAELMSRCYSKPLAEKFANLMSTYSDKAVALGSSFASNPSPGNIKDGLITDAMKSAGAAKKGGTSPVKNVLDYTEQPQVDGLSLLCTPGNDVESTTGLAGSGSNIIVFTTGLGTPTGNPITPVIKLSSNTKLAMKMETIIDFNTGEVIDSGKSIEEIGSQLLDFIIEVASGKETKAEKLGQDDFIPWKRGISL